MTVPGLGNAAPPNAEWLARKIATLEKQVAELRTARSLDASTISPDGTLTVDGTVDIAGNLDVSGSMNVSGNLDVNGTTNLDGTLTLASGAMLTASGDVESSNYVGGTSGWKLDGSSGNLEINNVTIRGGIIGNAALTSPVSPAIVNATDFNNTFTTSYATYLTRSVTVPAGFTQALVFAVASVVITSGTFVALNAKLNIDGTDSDVVEASATNAAVVVPVPFAILATGLSGSFNIQVLAEIIGSMTANSGSVYLSATVLFLR